MAALYAPISDLRVFVSSPFQGMEEERDRLVRRVFPELRRRCLAYQVSLCEIDLRWGITEEMAQRGGVLRLCLGEIDRCFPLFICILGERYGWVDPQARRHLEMLAPNSASLFRSKRYRAGNPPCGAKPAADGGAGLLLLFPRRIGTDRKSRNRWGAADALGAEARDHCGRLSRAVGLRGCGCPWRAGA